MSRDLPLLLVDNGSLQPAATLALRAWAARLAARLGRPVEPVSLLHSSAVDPDRLGGVPASIVEPWLKRERAAGRGCAGILPFFLGRSRAITEYLPERLAALGAGDVPVAPVLAESSPDAEERLATILAARILAADPCAGRLDGPSLALVDHGSPAPEVSALRDRVAAAVGRRLGRPVEATSMERRPGPEYAFSDPLLGDWLRTGAPEGPVVVAMFFLSPGRHAGPDGDVAEICAGAEAERPGLRVTRTTLLGDGPELLDLLEAQARAIGG